MRLCKSLLCLAATASVVVGQKETWPLHDDGLTDLVQWDHYSLIVNGERLFVFSGEFHPWRLPVPELWRDVMEKIKAAGFNAFSIYCSWGYHTPRPDFIDFSNGAHDLDPILEAAEDIGLYMIMRPGPYVNGETNAGGFPFWVTTGAYGELRDDDPRYTKAWTPYWKKICEIVQPHLITNGGNVILFQIENELGTQWDDIANRVLDEPVADYMQLLEDKARNSGIDVPLIHNAPNMNGFSWSKDFSNATGNVDLVGLDSYPSCWSCNLSECTGTNGEYVAYQTVDYYTYFTIDSPTQPNFMPEFQGGSYNPWAGPEGGCPDDTGADFANLFYRDLIYQRITAFSLYMIYGGTNWGWVACPVVATSYDYSGPISENRLIGDKYYETKLLALFTRAAKDLPYTDRVYNGTKLTTNEAITTSELRNPDTNAAFYVLRHDDSTSDSKETFKLKVNTTAGALTIPRYADSIAINGHQAKILATDFRFEDKKLMYSTAEVLSYTTLGGQTTLALWLPEGEQGEFSMHGVKSVKNEGRQRWNKVDVHKEHGRITVSYTQGPDLMEVVFDDGTRVLLLDRQTAYRFWAAAPDNEMATTENTVFVIGPYLVRSASYHAHDHTIDVAGDIDDSTAMAIFGPENIRSIIWNAKPVHFETKERGRYLVQLESRSDSLKLPTLESWRSANSLPEILSDYDPASEAWIFANHTTTPNPTKPDTHNPVLYVDDYGIHVGNHIFYATFFSTKEAPTGLYLDAIGGSAFGYSVWLNSDYIGSFYGASGQASQGTEFSFTNATLRKHSSNVLIVLMDNSGHELRDDAVLPRGITNATLLGPAAERYSFSEWRIAGTAGRENTLDPMRGHLNEGGLFAERVGMHLPGYPDSHVIHDLKTRTDTLVVPHAGVMAFRTTARLAIPAGTDVSVSFRMTSVGDETFIPSDPKYSNRLRALLFVNGYQYGRFNPYIGNQIDFPVPPGILDYNGGENTILVTVWSQDANGVEMKADWNIDYVHESSFDMKFDSRDLRPRWTRDRLHYA